MTMDHAVYFKELEARIVQLRRLHGQCSVLAAGILGPTLFREGLVLLRRA